MSTKKGIHVCQGIGIEILQKGNTTNGFVALPEGPPTYGDFGLV